MTTPFASPRASMPSAAATVVTPLTQEEDNEGQTVLLGSFQCSIVGIRYYSGMAHPGEYVQLVREANNPYDKNAIRVDNMTNQKVGHVKRQIAVALAPIMDDLEGVKLDGTIPYTGNDYTMPCMVEIYGQDVNDQTRVNAVLKRFNIRWKMTNLNGSTSTPTKAVVEVSKSTMDWKSAQQNLDAMFEKLSKDQLANLPEIEMPVHLTQTLFDHQIQGIRWLYHRETSGEQVPFYKKVREGGKEVWFSEITNSSQPTAPLPVKGSILADDMGLGKTLQSIGLVLANPPKPNAPKTTLIVCPVSVMPNWMQQIESHLQADTLKVAMYHSTDRHDLLTKLNEVDVLIASYGTISTDYGVENPKQGKEAKPAKKKKRKTKGSASIFEQMFHRIILDEAHTIRNTKSRTFAGITKLQATYRLCLTGTPLQNKPDDIHSLFSFLSVEPLGDKNVFRRAVAQPIQNGDDTGLARLRTMMAHVALRRTKAMTNLELVSKSVELRKVEYPSDSPHKSIHDALFESAQVAIRATMSAGDDKALRNYMMILETLTRIRQACVSGKLVPKERMEAAERVLAEVKGMKGHQLTPEEGEALLQKLKGAFEEVEAMECAVCLNEMEESAAVILRSCSHVFCEPCLSKVSASCRGLCPLCRQKFAPSDMVKKTTAAAAINVESSQPLSQSMDELGPSPKLEALGQAISEMKDDEKGVIFSQFTKFLDVVEPYIVSLGFTFTRIDGSKTATQRIAAMKDFSADGGPRFILCSLHAAGTGITLNRANHCFMMDTWWNVSVENQAMDRVHRIGQTRPVRVVRFVMKDTIEERMIALQEAKAAIGKGALQKLKPEEVRKTRIGDLKSLFSIKEEVSS